MELTVSPILPLWVIAALAVGLLVLLAHGCGLLAQKRVPAGWILALGGLRLLAVVLFVLCLLRPVVGVERNLSPKPDLLVMLDASASMGQKATPDSPPRLKQSVGELIRSGVTRRWYDHHRLHWFGFDRTAYTLPEDRVTRVAADGEGTDLTESLRTAVLSYRQDNAAAAERAQGLRVVLVSDGLDPGHDDPVRLARELGLSVDVVVPPSAEPVAAEPSLSIAGVQNPRRVLLGSEHRLHVKVRHEQMADQPLRLALVEDGQIRAQQTFRFAPGQAERRLSLAHRPASEGLKSYVLRLARVSDGDATPTGGVDAPLSDAVRADPYELTVRVLGRSSEVLVKRYCAQAPTLKYSWSYSGTSSVFS